VPILGVVGRSTTLTVAGTALVLAGVAVAALSHGHRHHAHLDDAGALWADARRDAAGHRAPQRLSTVEHLDGPPPAAAVFADALDGAPVRAALAASGISAQVTTEPGVALAAIVRGAPLLVVDVSRPEAESLLRTVRRRIDDGWSDCAVVACIPAWANVDVELSPLLDAVARYPITPGDLDVALRVARLESGDRRPVHDFGRFPSAPRARLV
jgi:hypothetical protein